MSNLFCLYKKWLGIEYICFKEELECLYLMGWWVGLMLSYLRILFLKEFYLILGIVNFKNNFVF